MLKPAAHPPVIPAAAEHIAFNPREGRGWDSVLSPLPSDPVCSRGPQCRGGAEIRGCVRREKQAVHFCLSILLRGTAQASGREANHPQQPRDQSGQPCLGLYWSHHVGGLCSAVFLKSHMMSACFPVCRL